jgi:hypothetical protein
MPDADLTRARRIAAKALAAEEFSQADAARVLGVTPSAVANLLKTNDANAGLDVVITQSKTDGVAALDRLFATVPHSRSLVGELTRWRIPADYAHELWRRAGLTDTDDLSQLVLSLTRPALEAFMDAAWRAEGHLSSNGKLRIISQKDGPTCEALKLGAYLLGHRPSDRQANANPQIRAIGLCRPTLGRRSLRVEPAGRGPVWCVQTELGTWTAREPGEVMPGAMFLTGNSYY